MSKSPLLSVILVSYNTSKLTIQAIRSVLDTYDEPVEIIVVDNNSSDKSPEILKKTFGSKIHVIENKENVGFARANNQGLAIAKGQDLLLLNSDTIVQPNALQLLLKAMEGNEHLGIAAASLQNLDGSYQPQGGALPTLFNVAAWWLWPFAGAMPGILPYQDASKPEGGTRDVVVRGWVGGTAMMIRRDVYEKIGGLDEAIFMYGEDVEYCLRARKSGWSIGIVPQAIVTHLGSASSSSSNARLGEVRGLLHLFHCYHRGGQELMVRVVIIKGSLFRYLLFGILKNSKDARSLYGNTLSLAWKATYACS